MLAPLFTLCPTEKQQYMLNAETLRRQVREEMRETWHRVYEQNYHKSLDHRSFYFKQTEKKNLGAKTMLQVCEAHQTVVSLQCAVCQCCERNGNFLDKNGNVVGVCICYQW